MDQDEIERWIQNHKESTDAQLRTTIAQKIAHCVDHVAARELLDRREKEEREAEKKVAERRHRETIEHTAKATRFARWSVVVSSVGVVGTIAGLLLPLAVKPSAQSSPLQSPSHDHVATPSSPTKDSPAASPEALPKTKAPQANVQQEAPKAVKTDKSDVIQPDSAEPKK